MISPIYRPKAPLTSGETKSGGFLDGPIDKISHSFVILFGLHHGTDVLHLGLDI